MSESDAVYSATYSKDEPVRDAVTSSILLSERVKARVRRVDPCKGRCLIENASPRRGIKYTHCLPRRFSRDKQMMSILEWFWGFALGTLNLNTRYNIFPVGASLHAIYDQPIKKPSWFLLPEDDIIRQFYDSIIKRDGCQLECSEEDATNWLAIRGKLPKFQETTFKYRLVPMMFRMRDMAILHQHTIATMVGESTSTNHFTVHVHPFKDLPWVTSHIDPKIVIFEAGRRLSLLPAPYAFSTLTKTPILKLIARIYYAWTRSTPDDALKDPDFNPSDRSHLNDGSESSTTTRWRCDISEFDEQETSSKRKRGEDSDDERDGKQQKGDGGLSRRGLDAHTRGMGDDKWTKESISEWSQSLSADLPDALD